MKGIVKAAEAAAWTRIERGASELDSLAKTGEANMDTMLVYARHFCETVASMKNLVYNIEQLVAPLENGDGE